MQIIFFIIVLTRLGSPHATKNYTSPRLDWLNGAHVHWDLRGSRFSIVSQEDTSYYGRRYLDFVLTRDPAGAGKRQTFEGSMNFWSTNRLVAMQLITRQQSRRLTQIKRIPLAEKDYLSEVINCPERSNYNLYIQFDRSSFSDTRTLAQVQRLFSRISLRK